MISGVVTSAFEAVVPIVAQGSEGQQIRLEAVVDTGFNGALSLPPEQVRALELPFIEFDQVTLADDTEVEMPLHEGAVLWNGGHREIVVHCAEGTPLVGMSLLARHRLTMDIIDNGPVTIQPLSGP